MELLDDRKFSILLKRNKDRKGKYANKIEIKKYGIKLKIELSDHRTKG